MAESQHKLRIFWGLVESKVQELRSMQASGELAKLQGSEYATTGAAWLTSEKPNWDDREARGGVVTGIYNFSLVGRRLIESTHRLSTETEVREFMTRTRREYAALKAEEDLRDGKTRVAVIEALPPTAAKK